MSVSIEKSIKPLQLEKEDLEAKSKDLSDINEILEVRVEDFSSDAIKQQLGRFEEIVTDDNLNELRNLVRDIIMLCCFAMQRKTGKANVLYLVRKDFRSN